MRRVAVCLMDAVKRAGVWKGSQKKGRLSPPRKSETSCAERVIRPGIDALG